MPLGDQTDIEPCQLGRSSLPLPPNQPRCHVTLLGFGCFWSIGFTVALFRPRCFGVSGACALDALCCCALAASLCVPLAGLTRLPFASDLRAAHGISQSNPPWHRNTVTAFACVGVRLLSTTHTQPCERPSSATNLVFKLHLAVM